MWYRKTESPFGLFLFRALCSCLGEPQPAAWLPLLRSRVFWTADTFALLQLLLFSLLSSLNHVVLGSQFSLCENRNDALADPVPQRGQS